MHIGYALIVVASLLRQVDACLSAIGAVYPPFVLLVIVATATSSSSTPPRARSSPCSPPRSQPS
jgi:hypothetical protein